MNGMMEADLHPIPDGFDARGLEVYAATTLFPYEAPDDDSGADEGDADREMERGASLGVFIADDADGDVCCSDISERLHPSDIALDLSDPRTWDALTRHIAAVLGMDPTHGALLGRNTQGLWVLRTGEWARALCSNGEVPTLKGVISPTEAMRLVLAAIVGRDIPKRVTPSAPFVEDLGVALGRIQVTEADRAHLAGMKEMQATTTSPITSVNLEGHIQELEEKLQTPIPTGCNQHTDCAAADQVARENGKRRPHHCHDECCEECFGC